MKSFRIPRKTLRVSLLAALRGTTKVAIAERTVKATNPSPAAKARRFRTITAYDA